MALTTLQSLEMQRIHDSRVRNAKDDYLKLSEVSTSRLEHLRHFDWLVIVRDPYTRTLSAFLEKFPKEEWQERYGKFEISKDGFYRFLVWLKEDGGLKRNGHWDLQSNQMFLPVNSYTTVIRFEKFEEDFYDLVSRLDPSFDRLIWRKFTEFRARPTESAKKLDHFYEKKSRRIVSELFQKDFDQLGYSLTE